MLLPLRLGGVLDDRLLAVDDVLLQLVAQHALDRLALVRLRDLLHGVGDGVGLEGEKGDMLNFPVCWHELRRSLVDVEKEIRVTMTIEHHRPVPLKTSWTREA